MAPQIPRLALVFGILTIAFFVVRTQAVPKSFGEKGFYRADFPAELAELQMSHAGSQACAECHSDKSETTAHFINGVACESCHGPSLKHVESFDEFKPHIPDKRAECGRCHAMIVGRRADFPQQDMKEHNPGQLCMSCHVVHDTATGGEE
jgi:formate-dependent nitrite reductase cytochrome c552 subunit